ncbi:MAG: DUF502 domain-containing protein, partial [Bacillota bacterium]|nr:DUF502 domain-containing protein [Bacillota bacterium]
GLFALWIGGIPGIGPRLVAIPGVGLILNLSVIVLVGMATANIVGRKILAYGDRLFSQTPVIRSIYNAVKQVVDAFASSSDGAFQQVVLVEYPRLGAYAIGFLTSSIEGEVSEHIGADVVAVFIPTTPNPTSGMLILLPRASVHNLNMPVDEGLKLIVSGGVVSPSPKKGSPKL